VKISVFLFAKALYAFAQILQLLKVAFGKSFALKTDHEPIAIV